MKSNNIQNDLHRILKDSEIELSNLMYMYLSSQFGVQVSVSEDYRNGKTDNSIDKITQNKTNHLRSNTGALLNSFFDSETFKINYSNGVVSGDIGSKLPYADIHEDGGFIKSKTQFSMFGGLMNMYFKTGDEAYKFIALSALKNGGVNIKARPYFKPFEAEFNREGLPKWWSEVENRLNQYINSVVFDV